LREAEERRKLQKARDEETQAISKLSSSSLKREQSTVHVEESSEDTDEGAKGKEEAKVAAANSAAKTATTHQASSDLWTEGAVNLDNEVLLSGKAFESKAWINAFRQAKRDNDEVRVSFLRRVVQRGTNNVLTSKSYERDGKTVKLNDVADSVKRTVFYDGKSAFGSFNRTFQTTAHFVRADIIEVALFLADRKNVNPVVLVMADEKRPGGSHEEGTCAMEESVYRRTTLKLNLEDPEQMDREREWK